jgi:hypothetical protein
MINNDVDEGYEKKIFLGIKKGKKDGEMQGLK